MGLSDHASRHDWSLGRLLVALMLVYLPVGMALPLLPLFVKHAVGGGGAVVGLVIGAEAVTAMLVRPFVGALSARHGRRVMISWAALLIALATAVNVVAGNLGLIIAGRLVLGLGSGTALAICQVWAIDLAGAQQRGRVLGQVGLVSFMAVGIGPPVALLLRSLGGFAAAWTAGGACAVAGGLLISQVPEPSRAVAEAAPHAWRGLRTALRPGLGVTAAFAGYASMASFAALALSSRGVAGGAAVLTSCAVSLIAVRLLLGGTPDRFGARPVALTCATSQAVGLLLLAFATSLPVALAAAALIGLGIANIYPAMGLRVIEQAHPEERTTAIASLGAFIDLGYAVGAPLAGAIVALAGYSAAFAVMAAVVLLAVNLVFFDPPGTHSIAAAAKARHTPPANHAGGSTTTTGPALHPA